MLEFLHIFFINLINDVDNGLILLAVMKRYALNRQAVVIYTVFLLTATRSIYVLAIDVLTASPGLRLACGLIVIAMAVRLIGSTSRSVRIPSTLIPWIKMTLLLLFTDFSICLDSVVVTAELSTRLTTASIGIFCSLTAVFAVIRLLPESVLDSGWIQIIAAGLMTHVAILGLVKDPWIADYLAKAGARYSSVNPHTASQIIAVDAAVIMIIAGIILRVRKQN